MCEEARPGQQVWSGLRRARVILGRDEIFTKVGGYVLGDFLT
jgi:hypothetical protein